MQIKRNLSYLLAYISIGLGFVGLTSNGWLTFLLPIYAFIVIPLMELVLTVSEGNLSKEEEEKLLVNKMYDWVVYLIVPAQWGLLILFLFSVQEKLEVYELVGRIITFGLACGVFGINVAHELGHRTKKYEQWMSKALLLTSQYMHFFIEHNRGHHKNVSTEDDPATSRYGELVYSFWFRSMIMGYISAWKLEFFKLSKQGRSKLHWRNEMVFYAMCQSGLLIAILFLFNWQTMVMYWISAIIGILLLESVNYIEHYGLKRHTGDTGNFKKVMPVHSWNSNHSLGRGILFELSRHSDHHYRPNRKYQILRHFEESPQMPTGYPGMIILALFPPLWFYVMNKRVRNLQEENSDLIASVV